MRNFTFHNPTRVLFGKGQIACLGKEVPKGARVLLTYGGGSIKHNGVYQQVMEALNGFEVLEFGGIEPNPTFETLMEIVEFAREKKIDFLLAVGGGSVLDGTKFISLAISYNGDPWDMWATRLPPRSAVPLGAVLTLPATGSESNCGAVISRRSTKEKLAHGHPLAFPRFAILDPETTFSLPRRQVANGIVDAFVHVMEQYLTLPADAPIQDRFSEGILRTLIEVGPATLEKPKEYAARASFMWSATLALNGLIGVGVTQDWSTHMLGHEITALHGLDHAQTLAIILPNLLWVQREGKRAKLLQYASRVWDINEGSEATRLEAGIVKTREFFESLGVSTHLQDYNISHDRVEEIIARLTDRKMLPMGESRDLDGDRIRQIFAMAR